MTDILEFFNDTDEVADWMHVLPGYKDELIISETSRISTKGGPGSGHFEHSGIPGHRGGSAPSGGGGSDFTSIARTAVDRFYTDLQADPEFVKAQGAIKAARQRYIKDGERIGTLQEEAKKIARETGLPSKVYELYDASSKKAGAQSNLDVDRLRLDNLEKSLKDRKGKPGASMIESLIKQTKVSIKQSEEYIQQAQEKIDKINSDPDYIRANKAQMDADAEARAALKRYADFCDGPEVQIALSKSMAAAKAMRESTLGPASEFAKKVPKDSGSIYFRKSLELENQLQEPDLTPENKREINARYDMVMEKYNLYLKRVSEYAQQKIRFEREVYTVKQPGTLSVSETEILPEMERSMNEGVTRFNQMVSYNPLLAYFPGASFKKEPPKVRVSPTGRAYSNDDGDIFVTPDDTSEIYVHELAHTLEVRDPLIKKLTNQFLSQRTGSEKAVKLRELKPDIGYRDDEIVKVDKFFSPYCGKIYDNKATEIFSMGIEAMGKGTYDFARDDPEYFDFIYALARIGGI